MFEQKVIAAWAAHKKAMNLVADTSDDAWMSLDHRERNAWWECVRAVTSAPAAPQPAQQPTDEHKAIMLECRNQAMRWTLEARIPEAGAFGGIAQDLDYLCAQLGVKND